MSECDLAKRQCVPCQGGVPPLEGEELYELHRTLGNGWQLIADHHVKKTFKFEDFATALEYINRVGAMAEEQGHHPDIFLAWGKVDVMVWTHKIDGLTESDFIFAAKADELY